MSHTRYYVFLSHGLESGPNANKIQALKAVADTFSNVTTVVLDHRSTKDPKERLTQMEKAIKGSGASPDKIILAGSSMGGWVCAQTASQMPVLGCLLLAPAIGLSAYPNSNPNIQAQNTLIIHGWDDDVVPIGPVIEFAQSQRLPLMLVPDGHRLKNSLDRIVGEFRKLLEDSGLTD